MLFLPAEMDVKLVEVLQKSSKGCAFRHLGESVHILRETLATITVLAVGTGNMGVFSPWRGR